jgi:acyl transferase domain-containing protein
MAELKVENVRTGLEIAVIGMAGRFPGEKHIDKFWSHLKKGIESISFFSDQELVDAGIAPGLLENPGYVKAKGAMADIEHFDASFFEYTAKEAEIMDPQLRILHESCWEALESAGCDPWSYKGLIGLYAGASHNYFWLSRFLAQVIQNQMAENELFELATLNSNSSFCTRISYKLNLKGPSVFVQTACSTSLVAIHLACQGLLAGECDMALAGGVSISIPKKSGHLYQEGMLLSLRGHVRTFDAHADGTVFGNGVGIVVLKPLENAIADGDTIYAVVKGSAINNDGYQKVGFTAPGTKGQAAVIRAALRAAEVEPESISYIEAHGTGTTLGDPIEIEALTQAFNTNKTGFCKIGSLKSNIGHLDAAAGVAGFIKTVLALKYRMIPPSLNFESPNPEIDFANTPFCVNTTLTKWKNDKYPLRAGVSSFGLGGSNAHVILEQAPIAQSAERKAHGSWSQGRGGVSPPSKFREYQLILLSARTETALERMTQNLAQYLKRNPNINLEDAAYTLQVGRKGFNYRKMTVCSTIDETIETLSSPETGNVQTSLLKVTNENRPVVFMFSGQGSQYVNMGLDLFKKEPAFREEVDRCIDILKTIMDYNIKDILYPGESSANLSEEEARRKMDHVLNSGPIKFTFEYALANLLIKRGIKPYAMIGHSFGEYVAAHLSGVFSIEDALKLVVWRGRLMERTPEGAMMSVSLSEHQLKPLLKNKISLAAVNTSSLCIVSGLIDAVDGFEKELKEKGCDCVRLNFPRASHSEIMNSIKKDFERIVSQVTLSIPRIPYISGLTGDWISGEQATSPAYWANHFIKTVRFSDGIKNFLKKTRPIFVQVGCDRGLPLFVSQHQDGEHENPVINMVRHRKEKVSDVYYLLKSIGFLWLNGVKIDWSEFYSEEKRHRLALPTYPFERQRFWCEVNPLQMGKKSLETQLLSYRKEEKSEPRSLVTMETDINVRNLHKKPIVSAAYTSPSNEIEQVLVNIWQDFFGFNRVGIDDDFFELGGDSLKASIFINKIHKKFNVKVPLAEFFEKSTIKSLALFLAYNIGENIYFPIEPVEKKEYYQLSSAQKRLVI